MDRLFSRILTTAPSIPVLSFLSRTDPDGREQWRQLNPDVPVLLTKFKTYLAELNARGAVARAKEFDKARREKKYNRIFQDGPASEIKQIGDLYLYGMGTTQDYGLAAKWYRRAADLGCAEARLRLAILYLDGIGVTQNMEQAHFWLSLTAQDGSRALVEQATPLLKKALKKMTAGQIAAANKRVRDMTPNSQPCE